MESFGTIILNNTYRDSVFLMNISSKVTKLNGIIDASAMMGTDRNKDLFYNSGLYNDDVKNALADDLIIAIKADSQENLDNAIKEAKSMLNAANDGGEKTKVNETPKTLEDVLAKDDDFNVLMLSVAGDYAKYEAIKALNKGLNIMLYSDNISIEDELALKRLAHSKGLLVMGPDCGTSIINTVPLAFANNIRKGSIGIVGASGTGIQETSSIIHRYGGGISQAIGTGGRDPKESIGGITMMDALEMLKEDEQTKTILIISKPPCAAVKAKINRFIQSCSKPVIVNYAGEDDYTDIRACGGHSSKSLKDAAFKALEYSKYELIIKQDYDGTNFVKLREQIANLAPNRKYIRAIYSGGSLCYEAMHVAVQNIHDELYSNTPIKNMKQLDNVYCSRKHTYLDIGDDVFTVGKPHPMINPEDKVKRIIQELKDEEVAVILTDCVIGYGSCDNPAKAIADAIIEAREHSDNMPIVIASVCGTEEDRQVYSKQVKILEEAGILVLDSNYEAAKLSTYVIDKINQKEMNHE